jgi:hypothetical protein
MLRKFFYVFISISLCLFSHAQIKSSLVKGTLNVAVIVNDSIIVEADSRGAIYAEDNYHKPLAHMDVNSRAKTQRLLSPNL